MNVKLGDLLRGMGNEVMKDADSLSSHSLTAVIWTVRSPSRTSKIFKVRNQLPDEVVLMVL